MLDLKHIVENTDDVAAALQRRNTAADLPRIVALGADRGRLIRENEALREKRNKVSQEIAKLKKNGRKPPETLLKDMREVGERAKELTHQLEKVEAEIEERLLTLPNLPHPSVKSGKDASDNTVLREWGEKPAFSFSPAPHWDLGENLAILDFVRGAKLAGARFTLYRGAGARLERALINFMLDLHTTRHGYREVLPPFMVNRKTMTATGQLPKFEEDLFRLKDDEYLLIPTAEVPLTNIHQDELLEYRDLPLSYTAYTPCFRREAGSYGKDVRGLIRQHQFNKVELVKLTAPEQSEQALEELTRDAEQVLQQLGLHYRVVELCSGDMGFAAMKTYDLEVWLPPQKAYREISSCSNCGDFQARRAKIRYRPESGGKPRLVHSLNGSGLAVGRTLIAILENYQQADGSINIPPVLQPYMGGMTAITPEAE